MVIQTSYLLGNSTGLQISATVSRITPKLNYLKKTLAEYTLMKYYAHIFINYEITLYCIYLTAFLSPLDCQTMTSNPVPPDVFDKDRCSKTTCWMNKGEKQDTEECETEIEQLLNLTDKRPTFNRNLTNSNHLQSAYYVLRRTLRHLICIISFNPWHNSVRQVVFFHFKDNKIESQRESKKLTQGHTPSNSWNW